MIVLLFFLIILHILILSKLIFFPYPELFVYPYLTNNGLVPYKDILDQHFPGLMFFPVNLGTLGMNTPADARLWQYGIVVVTHILLYLVGKRLFGPKKALIANLFYFIWQPFFEGWVLWIDSFIPILLLPAFYFVNEFFDARKDYLKLRFIFLTGLFLGSALVFKQVILPLCLLVALIVYFKTKDLRYVLALAFGGAFPVMTMVVYILKLDVWNDFYFWTVKFNTGTFAQMGRKYPTLGDIVRVGLIMGLPVFLAVKAYLKTKTFKALLLFNFLLGTFVFVYARFDPVHLQPALPFVALLAVFVINKTPRYFLNMVLVVYIVLGLALLFRFYSGHIGTRIFFFESQEAQLVEIIEDQTITDDKIFAFATTPHIYQLADRLPPGNIFVFHFPWFLEEAQGRLLDGLKVDPPKVVLREKNAFVEGKVLVKYAPLVDNYITENYKLLKMVGGVEVLVEK